MKKLTYFILSILFFVLAACSNDDSNNTPSVVGKWKFTSTTIPDNHEPCDYLGWTEYKSNGTIEDYDACDNVTSGGTWNQSGNNLTFISSTFPIPITVQVLSVTSTTMVLKTDISGETENITFTKIN